MLQKSDAEAYQPHGWRVGQRLRRAFLVLNEVENSCSKSAEKAPVLIQLGSLAIGKGD